MNLLDWLNPSRVLCPVEAETLEELLWRLLGRGREALGLSSGAREKAARDLAFGTRGEVVRVHSEVVAVLAEQEGLGEPLGFLGITGQPFQVTAEGKEEPGSARAVFLILVPGRLTSFRARLLPELRRFFSEEPRVEAFLEAGDPGSALAVPGLEVVSIPEQPLVGEALQPARYRVYAETPVDELVDLMVRRGLHAVPVVGEGYEVLGIVTTGDALDHLLARSRAGGEEEPGLARDVMTRAVLCVSEDQELREVAQLMVNRDVEQVPVVREGQLVGFITRDSVLAALFGAPPETD